MKKNRKFQRAWALSWKYFWGLRKPWLSPKNLPSTNLRRMQLSEQMNRHQHSKQEGKKVVMKAKEVLIQTTAQIFDVSPDSVEHFFRTTGLWEQPEFQEELPDPVRVWFENMNLPLARIFATTLLDRLGVSMNKLELTLKKG